MVLDPNALQASIFLLYLGPFLTDQCKRESGCVEKEEGRKGDKRKERDERESENMTEQRAYQEEEIGARDRDFPGGPVLRLSASKAGGLGLIPGHGTGFHMPQLGPACHS